MTINVKNFLKDKPKLSKMGEFQELQPIEGMEISAISADLYGTGRDDLCLFYFKDGANYGAVYTQIIQYVQSQLPGTDRSEKKILKLL